MTLLASFLLALDVGLAIALFSAELAEKESRSKDRTVDDGR
jgi:hypothetical protein